MRRDAAERRGILIVHVAAPRIAVRRVLGRRDPLAPLVAGPIAQLHIGAELAIAPAIELTIERFAGGILDREAEQHEAGIAVDRLTARRIVERLFTDCELE